MRSQLSWAIASFSLDQYLYYFSDHWRLDCTPWYTDIFRLVLRLVSLGLVHDYDSYWHVTTFIFSYSWPWTLVGIFSTWIFIVFLASMYAKSMHNVMSNWVRPAGSLPLHFWVIYNVFWPSQILLWPHTLGGICYSKIFLTLCNLAQRVFSISLCRLIIPVW